MHTLLLWCQLLEGILEQSCLFSEFGDWCFKRLYNIRNDTLVVCLLHNRVISIIAQMDNRFDVICIKKGKSIITQMEIGFRFVLYVNNSDKLKSVRQLFY